MNGASLVDGPNDGAGGNRGAGKGVDAGFIQCQGQRFADELGQKSFVRRGSAAKLLRLEGSIHINGFDFRFIVKGHRYVDQGVLPAFRGTGEGGAGLTVLLRGLVGGGVFT